MLPDARHPDFDLRVVTYNVHQWMSNPRNYYRLVTGDADKAPSQGPIMTAEPPAAASSTPVVHAENADQGNSAQDIMWKGWQPVTNFNSVVKFLSPVMTECSSSSSSGDVVRVLCLNEVTNDASRVPRLVKNLFFSRKAGALEEVKRPAAFYQDRCHFVETVAGFGNAIVSSVPIKHRVKVSSSIGYSELRGLVGVCVEVAGDDVWIFTTHLDVHSEVTRKRQWDELLPMAFDAAVKASARDKEPCLLFCGDFNALLRSDYGTPYSSDLVKHYKSQFWGVPKFHFMDYVLRCPRAKGKSQRTSPSPGVSSDVLVVEGPEAVAGERPVRGKQKLEAWFKPGNEPERYVPRLYDVWRMANPRIRDFWVSTSLKARVRIDYLLCNAEVLSRFEIVDSIVLRSKEPPSDHHPVVASFRCRRRL